MLSKKRPPIKDEFDLTLRGHKPFQPRGVNQFEYYKAMRTHSTVIGIGPAGAGKTYVAASYAAEQIATGQVEKLILTRPKIAIEGEDHGFLPGNLIAKMAPWTAPIIDVLVERIGFDEVTAMLKDGRIQVIPLGFIRGRTFNRAVVMLDEGQNSTPGQMKAFLTRIGEDATYIVDGDLEQSDLEGRNGLLDLVDLVETLGLPVPIIEFTEKDIVRSAECAMWVAAYRDREEQPQLPLFVTRGA